MTVVVVDTNVAVTANGTNLPFGVNIACVAECGRRLRSIQLEGVVAIDDGWQIVREYRRNVNEAGRPGVGDAFLKWLLTNLTNARRCHQVTITPTDEIGNYVEFPTTPELASFDLSDRKFVAVSLAHPDRPPILNATDSDWRYAEVVLQRCGVIIEHLCPVYLENVSEANA